MVLAMFRRNRIRLCKTLSLLFSFLLVTSTLPVGSLRAFADEIQSASDSSMKGGDLLEEDEVGEELLAASPTPGEQLDPKENDYSGPADNVSIDASSSAVYVLKERESALDSSDDSGCAFYLADPDDSQITDSDALEIADSAAYVGDADALAVLDMVELRQEGRAGDAGASLATTGEGGKPYHTTRDGSDVAGQTPGTPEANKNEVAADNPSSAYSQGLPSEHDNKIENVWIHWASSDTDGAWQDDANRLGFKPEDDTPLSMQYQVEFDLSGQYDYEPGSIEFTIPASIWYDRSANPVGYTTLSVPEDPDDGAEFAYRLIERGGEQLYLITNTRRMSATSKVMFQFSVRGITLHAVEDNIISKPIQTTVIVTTHDGTVIGFDSNVIDATIDTSEEVYRASKSGRLFEKPDEVPAELLANLPDGADPADYIYVRWYTYCYHRGNQEFELSLEDTLADPYHGVVLGVVGCDAVPSEDDRSIEAPIFEGYHEDTAYIQDHIQYLWSAYPKTDPETGEEQFPAGGVYDEFTNTAVWSLAEGDHVGDSDYVTTASADAQVTYAPIKYTVIPGDFGLDKWTENIYKDYQYGFALSALRSGRAFDMNFRVRVVGKLWSWTLGEGLDPEDPASYGKRDIHFETEDYATYFNYDFEHELGSDDFEFVSVDIPAPVMYTWSSGSNGTYGYRSNGDPAARPDVTLLVKRTGAGEYVEYAVIGYATGEPVVELTDEAVSDGATVEGSRIVFPTDRVDITDIKLAYTTHEAEIDLNYYPVIRLKPSARILEQVEQIYAASDEPTTKLRNDSKARITYADTGAEISDTDHVTDERLHNWHRSYATLDDAVLAVNSDKSLDYDPARDNDAAMRRITLHYTAHVYEQSNIRNRGMYDAAVEAGAIAAETSGVWYDLLPKGVVPDMASIALRESDSIRNAYTIENYKGSGRTLLVVEADLAPDPVFRTGSYGDVPTISFDAWYRKGTTYLRKERGSFHVFVESA